jgi:aldose 1-epimerase
VGFDRYVWKAEEVPGGVEFTHVSPDGDMGFPGTLTAKVKYTLAGNTLRLDYSATTDKETVVNMTNHAYFNLRGDDDGNILGHKVQLNADHYTPVDSGLIPTGELAPVAGTPLDFRTPHVVGDRIEDKFEQMVLGHGYDHNFAVNGAAGTLRHAATVVEPESGRKLTVETTEPGIQFYSGNFLDGTFTGRHGKAYARRTGFCLETQHFPDAPNHPEFLSTTLKPGETMHSTTTFTFGVEK